MCDIQSKFTTYEKKQEEEESNDKKKTAKKTNIDMVQMLHSEKY